MVAHRIYRRLILRVAVFGPTYSSCLTLMAFTHHPHLLMLEHAREPVGSLIQILVLVLVSFLGIPVITMTAAAGNLLLGTHIIGTEFHCRSCAYDRKGISIETPCPECGKTQTETRLHPIRIKKTAWRASLAIVAMFTIWNTIGLARAIREIAIPASRFIRSLPATQQSHTNFYYPKSEYANLGNFSTLAYEIDASLLPQEIDPWIENIVVTFISTDAPHAPQIQFRVMTQIATSAPEIPIDNGLRYACWHLDAEAATRFFATGGLTEQRLRDVVQRTRDQLDLLGSASEEKMYFNLDW